MRGYAVRWFDSICCFLGIRVNDFDTCRIAADTLVALCSDCDGSRFAVCLSVTTSSSGISIDEYLRELLTPAEASIPRLAGIEMHGDSVPAGSVGGDLFEYINFQYEYDIEARIANAVELSQDLLDRGPLDAPDCNFADDYMDWLRLQPSYRIELEPAYREIRSLEKARIAENLGGL